MRDLIPARRTSDLVIRESGDETLVFDTRTDAVHCLPTSLSSVWLALDSASSLAELASSTGTTEGSVSAALASLDELELLDVPAGFDRRQFLTRAGLVGAGTVGAMTVFAPAALAANTGAAVTLTGTPTSTTQMTFTGTFANFSNGTIYATLYNTTSTPRTKVGTQMVTIAANPTTYTTQAITTTAGNTFVVVASSDAAGANVIATSNTFVATV